MLEGYQRLGEGVVVDPFLFGVDCGGGPVIIEVDPEDDVVVVLGVLDQRRVPLLAPVLNLSPERVR